MDVMPSTSKAKLGGQGCDRIITGMIISPDYRLTTFRCEARNVALRTKLQSAKVRLAID